MNQSSLVVRGSRRIVLLALHLLLVGFVARSYADVWVTGYYAGWMQGYLPASEIDYGAVTHIIHFNLLPKTDGSLDSTTDMVYPQYSADLISRAHAAGVPVLISVGGENTAAGFRGATSSPNLARVVSHIDDSITSRDYDDIGLHGVVLVRRDA